MKTFLFILSVLIIFILGYAFIIFLFEIYIRRNYRRNVDRKIKEILFRELGFTYRETSYGRGFLIIDEYKERKAIQL